MSYNFKKYRTPACTTCLVKHLCTGRQDGRREIERSEYADAVERNNANYKANKELYRKRQWGYHHTNLRGLEKVGGEMALIMTVYNLKRSVNLLGMAQIVEKLQKWVPNYERVSHCQQKWLDTRHFKATKENHWKFAT